MRKIIQIAHSQPNDTVYGQTIALCDDGTLWQFRHGYREWTSGAQKWSRLPDIPQEESPSDGGGD